jgi:hypothetical protein
MIACAADAPFRLRVTMPRPAGVATGQFALAKSLFGPLHQIVGLFGERFHRRISAKQRCFRTVEMVRHIGSPQCARQAAEDNVGLRREQPVFDYDPMPAAPQRDATMTQNVYDNEEFFAGFSRLRRSVEGLDGMPEWPALRALLPDLVSVRGDGGKSRVSARRAQCPITWSSAHAGARGGHRGGRLSWRWKRFTQSPPRTR